MITTGQPRAMPREDKVDVKHLAGELATMTSRGEAMDTLQKIIDGLKAEGASFNGYSSMNAALQVADSGLETLEGAIEGREVSVKTVKGISDVLLRHLNE